jgi:hypothetical protein
MKKILDSGKTNCPICYDDMEKVFNCQKGDNSNCGKCTGRLEGQPKTCPNCRQNLAARPLVRNKAAERLINK